MSLLNALISVRFSIGCQPIVNQAHEPFVDRSRYTEDMT